jgi:hypothetical protein
MGIIQLSDVGQARHCLTLDIYLPHGQGHVDELPPRTASQNSSHPSDTAYYGRDVAFLLAKTGINIQMRLPVLVYHFRNELPLLLPEGRIAIIGCCHIPEAAHLGGQIASGLQA